MNKLNITDDVLDKLGFSDYRDGAGDYGTRTLTFNDGSYLRITEQDQMDDGNEGWAEKKYISNHFFYFERRKTHDLFFLHELRDCIKTVLPSCVAEFEKKCHLLGMKSYL